MAIELWRPGRALRRVPFRDLSRVEREMEEMFGRFSRGWPSLQGEGEALGWAPAVDVVDRNGEVVLRADLPGLTEKDIQLTLQDGSLTIQGERKEEKEEKDENYYCCERSYGSFSRSLAVPAGVNADKINATFKNGVLEVHLPKTKESTGKKIEVKAA
jgi:HSP20 family protein